jgi:hypothetical protein
MPTQTANVGNDFSSVLAKAQELPFSEQHGRDLADGFPFAPAPHHKVVDTNDADPRAIPGVVKYSAKIHRRVFTIYRPWDSCSRCKDDVANNKVAIPDAGDYDCPHNNKDDYEKVINDILAGRLMMGSEQEVVQRDGTIVISLRWYERIPNKTERRQMMKAAAIAGGQREEPPL